MKAVRVNLSIGGFFVTDENDKMSYYSFKSDDPAVIAQKVFDLERELVSPELNELLQSINRDSSIVVNSSLIEKYIKIKYGHRVEIDISSEQYFKFQDSLIELLITNNFVSSSEQYHKIVREVNILLSKKRVAVASQRTDKMIVHAILTLDDLMTTINLFMSRIREWYGIHFPEILKDVENHETLCRMITEMGARANYSSDILSNYGFSRGKIDRIVSLAKSSMGAPFDNNDLEPLRRFAVQTLELFNEKRYLEQWIEEHVDKVAPNVKAIVGAPIAARLIALAGGLKEMALMPSSTIQLLGAEKALFRALKTGAKPPKHGVIYQMPELHSCKWWQRGNIARAIAGKLTIAARIDAFQGEYRGDELRMDLDRKIKDILEKYNKPPEGKTEPIANDQRAPRGQRRSSRSGKYPKKSRNKKRPKGNRPSDKRKQYSKNTKRK